jgi:hypothetical protein
LGVPTMSKFDVFKIVGKILNNIMINHISKINMGAKISVFWRALNETTTISFNYKWQFERSNKVVIEEFDMNLKFLYMSATK